MWAFSSRPTAHNARWETLRNESAVTSGTLEEAQQPNGSTEPGRRDIGRDHVQTLVSVRRRRARRLAG